MTNEKNVHLAFWGTIKLYFFFFFFLNMKKQKILTVTNDIFRYAPLSVRLVEFLQWPGWRAITEVLNVLPGPTLSETQQLPSALRQRRESLATFFLSTVARRKVFLLLNLDLEAFFALNVGANGPRCRRCPERYAEELCNQQFVCF